ncbi:MAG: transglutaminase domain-containing protein, partial [Lachnospiraceae bacterium]|nr:transglutaminase domain-containing protein [Lachnospiraceae bacterium]
EEVPEEDPEGLIEDPDREETLFAVSETMELSDPAVVSGDAFYGIKALDLVSYSGCFGNQLSGTARKLYDARVDYYVNGQNTGTMKLSYDRAESPVTFSADVVTNENGSKQIDQTTEAYKEFRQEVVFSMQSSLDAMIYDHPEIFWLRGGTYTFSVGAYGSSAKGWVGYLSGISYTPKIAFDGAEAMADLFQSGVAQAVSQIQAEADAKGNQDGNTDMLELAREAHDYLCRRLYYDTAALQSYQETGDYRIFCAAGAFVDSVGAGAVCEGYAKAYKILCDRMGIPCVLIGGTVVQGGRSEGHMWNGVYLAGGWYLTDVTWDDKSSGYTYDYFMMGNITEGRSSSGNFSGSEAGNTTLFTYPALSADPLNPCAANSHSWDGGIWEAATCTEPAHTLYTCTRCGLTYRSGYTGAKDPNKHDYRETERRAASCTESGYILYTCTRACTENHTRKQTLPALGHYYVNGVCTRCGLGDTLAHASVSAVAARTYTGSRITPVPTVKFGTNTLKFNTDYRLTYQNNLRAGTATITLQGIGKYSGTKIVAFQIKKKSISGLTYGKVADRVYTGKSQWPGITLKDESRSLVRGTDYSLSYSNNKAVGTAVITVKGIGSYTGTKKLTFCINPKTVTGQKVTSKTRGKITVSWKRVAGSSGYQIQYALSSNFSGAKSVTAKAGSSSKIISGLKRGKRYYVRIRSYRTVKGKKYYSSWCTKKKVTVKK